MRSGWPHTQEEPGALASQRQAQYGPADSWPNGYPALGNAEGDFRYPTHGMDPYGADLPSAPAAGPAGEHPYAAFGGAPGAPNGNPQHGSSPHGGFGGAPGAQHGNGEYREYTTPDIEAFGYGDPGYSDPRYDGPVSQDAGIAGTQTVRGVVESAHDRGYQGGGYQGGYQGGGSAELGYPAPSDRMPSDRMPSGHMPSGHMPSGHVSSERDNGALYQQPWDYDQPLRYEGEEPAYPLHDGYDESYGDGFGGGLGDGYGGGFGQTAPTSPAYEPAAYNPGDYNGSDLSMPGIGGAGYDLSGIIGTGEFPEIDYDQPGYDRLSYDDPRFDSRFDTRDGFGTPDGFETRGSSTRFDMPAIEDEPRGGSARSDTRFDMPALDAPMLGAPVSDAPVMDRPMMDMPAVDMPPGSPRFDSSTRFDMPAVDNFGASRADDNFGASRGDHAWPAREDVPGYSGGTFTVDSFAPDSFSPDSFGADSFAGDSFAGDTFAGDSFAGGALNQTSLDLGTGHFGASQTRFDMPAVEDYQYGDRFQQTSVDGMRALAPDTEFRPAGSGLVAPADEQPVSWADETSFDRFGDLDEMSGLDDLDAQDVPAAFTRVPETTMRRTGLDTGARRAVGKRRGRSGDKRQWLALGAICVAAAGAITFVMMKTVFSGPSGPAHSVSTPDKAGGFTRQPNLEQQMKVAQLRDNIIANGGGKISGAVGAVYQLGSNAVGSNPQTYVFVGGKLADSDPQASLTDFEQTYKQGGAHVVSPGSLGGEAACATATVSGESVSMCVWFDNDTFGEFVSPTMTPGKLASTMEQARPSLEHLA